MSKQIIAEFSALQTNPKGDYERFYYVKSYLRMSYKKTVFFRDFKHSFQAKLRIKEIMKNLGRKNLKLFLEKRKAWENLETKVPLKYLELIGASIDKINFYLKVDSQAYSVALKEKVNLKTAILRIMPAFYLNLPIPENLTEAEAIDYIQKKAGDKRAAINISDLKTIWIDPQKKPRYRYYPPELKFSKNFMIPSKDGRNIGTTVIR